MLSQSGQSYGDTSPYILETVWSMRYKESFLMGFVLKLYQSIQPPVRPQHSPISGAIPTGVLITPAPALKRLLIKPYPKRFEFWSMHNISDCCIFAGSLRIILPRSLTLFCIPAITILAVRADSFQVHYLWFQLCRSGYFRMILLHHINPYAAHRYERSTAQISLRSPANSDGFHFEGYPSQCRALSIP